MSEEENIWDGVQRGDVAAVSKALFDGAEVVDQDTRIAELESELARIRVHLSSHVNEIGALKTELAQARALCNAYRQDVEEYRGIKKVLAFMGNNYEILPF